MEKSVADIKKERELSLAYKDIFENSRGWAKKEIVKKIAEVAYQYPMDTDEFIEGMDLIKSIGLGDGYLLCCERKWEVSVFPPYEITDLRSEDSCHQLSGYHTFCEAPYYDEGYLFKKQSEVEYDLRIRQVCASAIITDYKDIICLHTSNRGRIPDKLTMMQGHVSFNKSAYTTPQLDYVRNSMLSTVYDLVTLRNPMGNDHLLGVPMFVSDMPKFITNSKRTLPNAEHIGFVYIIKIESCREAFELLKSKNPNKHTLTISPLEVHPLMDTWLASTVMSLSPKKG